MVPATEFVAGLFWSYSQSAAIWIDMNALIKGWVLMYP